METINQHYRLALNNMQARDIHEAQDGAANKNISRRLKTTQIRKITTAHSNQGTGQTDPISRYHLSLCTANRGISEEYNP